MLRRRMMMGQSGNADYSTMYLTFKALESGTFSFSRNTISYSLDDGSTWIQLLAGVSTPSVAAGHKICFKASGLTVSTSYGIGTFSATGNFEAYGNIMSMSDGDNYATATSIANTYQFQYLFQANTHLVSAKNIVLPATSLSSYCYRYMFIDCSSLTSAPMLPATTLTQACYAGMFYGCTSLASAPELPAPTLVSNSYNYMFYGCSSLNYIKCLATDISATPVSWVSNVAASGTFVKAASMSSWTTGASGIPSGWTVIDAT